MELSTRNLVLDAESSIDLQTHTIFSDGTWTPEALIDYVKSERFGLVGITDHDRVDTVTQLQGLALEKQQPVLVAAEMSTQWKGQSVDVLCFGFDADANALRRLTENIRKIQHDSSVQAYEKLVAGRYFPAQADTLKAILEKPPARHPHEFMVLLRENGHGTEEAVVWKIANDAGVIFATNPIAAVVEAAHADGAVCLIAHPGRGQYFPKFDAAMLDEIRQDAPLDGFEAYYPLHTAEQTTMFVEYAEQHDLLVSSGSDSHFYNRQPIQYPARLSRKLLERVGIEIR